MFPSEERIYNSRVYSRVNIILNRQWACLKLYFFNNLYILVIVSLNFKFFTNINYVHLVTLSSKFPILFGFGCALRIAISPTIIPSSIILSSTKEENLKQFFTKKIIMRSTIYLLTRALSE